MLCVLGISLISESDQETDSQAEELPSLSPKEVVKTGLFYQVRTSQYFLSSGVSISHYQIYFGFLAVCSSQVHIRDSRDFQFFTSQVRVFLSTGRNPMVWS